MPNISDANLTCIACEVCVTEGSSADKLGVRMGHLQHMDVHVACCLSTSVVLCRDGQDSHSAWHPECVAHRPLQSLPGVAGQSIGQVCQSASCTLILSVYSAAIDSSAFADAVAAPESQA